MENVSPVTLLFNFAFFYPMVMAFFWMVGGIYYYLRRALTRPDAPPRLRSRPPVSVLVPCFTKPPHIADTIHAIAAQVYPRLEIIAINDGSRDARGGCRGAGPAAGTATGDAHPAPSPGGGRAHG